MTLDDFREMLAGMTAEERAEFLSAYTSSYDDRGQQLSTEQAYADRLREEPMPGMRDTGRFKIAANPLEFASTVAHRGLGGYRSKKIADQREAMASNKEQALQQLVGHLLSAGSAPVTATSAAPMAPSAPAGSYAPMGIAALVNALRRPGSG